MQKRLLISLIFIGLMAFVHLNAQNADVAKLSPERIAAANELAMAFFQNHPKDTPDQDVAAAIKAAFLQKFPNLPSVPQKTAINLDDALKNKDKFLEERMEHALPIPSDEELALEAEKKFPLYKLGEKVKVTYMSPNQNKDIPTMYEGYYRGTTGPYIKINSMPILIQHMKQVEGNELEILKFDPQGTAARRKEYIREKKNEINDKRVAFLKEQRGFSAIQLIDNTVDANESAGYTYADGEWLEVEKLLLHAVARAKKRIENAAATEEQHRLAAERKMLDGQIESISVNATLLPQGERINPEKLIAKQEAARKAREEALEQKRLAAEAAKAKERAEAEKAQKLAKEKELAEAQALVQQQAELDAEKRAKDNEKLDEMRREMAQTEELKKMQTRSLMRVVLAICVFLVFLIIVASIMVWQKTQKKDPFKKYFEGKGQLQKDFWTAASSDPDNFKYVAYMFPDLKQATQALGKLSYFNIGPGGDLKCVRDLRYGVYPHLDGAVCFVGGTKFTYALWKEASIVLPELPNASYFKVSTEPKVLLELPDLAKLSETQDLHITSLGVEDVEGENGEFNRVFKYKTDTIDSAKHFLDTIDIKEAGIIIHIETNEGVIGKDENGIFSIDD
ncbi:MAG: hypothetical protein IKP58_07420 [Victivallales bacterium]|nr:hypothetical protein [Victivallales bacterium]